MARDGDLLTRSLGNGRGEDLVGAGDIGFDAVIHVGFDNLSGRPNGAADGTPVGGTMGL
jgi:hypothetical protein